MHAYMDNGRFQVFKNKNLNTFKTWLTAGCYNGKLLTVSFFPFFAIYLIKLFYADIMLDLKELYLYN